MQDPTCCEAVETSELFADGLVSEQALDIMSNQANEIYEAEMASRGPGENESATEDLAYAAWLCSGSSLGPGRLLTVLSTVEEWGLGVPGSERAAQAAILRDISGNPFRPSAFSPEWRTSTAVALAAEMYEARDFFAMPILADALQDAGCDNADILTHCRGPGPHVRGCWVVDLVLGKE
jgi:hypothetical protein